MWHWRKTPFSLHKEGVGVRQTFIYFCIMLNHFRKFIETPLFGVCTWLGEKMGIKATTIRMYFVYLSFFTFGSPIIIYFVMAFLLENKNYFKPKKYKRPSVWDL